MSKSVVIIGRGSAGLILALGLRKKGFDVSVLDQLSESEGNSALICPELVMEFLEKLEPGIVTNLQHSGARLISHEELLRMKFPGFRVEISEEASFLVLSRRLLIEDLSLLARKYGVKFIQEEVQGLHLEGKIVSSVKGSVGDFKADLVFDCTGTYSRRRSWLGDKFREEIYFPGVQEEIFQRFFQGAVRPGLILGSHPECRGGIYPVEGDAFVLSLSIPAGHQNLSTIDDFAMRFLSGIGAMEQVKAAKPQGEWKVVARQVFKSDYYQSAHTQIPNLFPVGEGVLSSLPVFGRGISLVVLQLSPLFDSLSPDAQDDDVMEMLREGFIAAEEKWKEVSDGPSSKLKTIFKRWALRIVESNPQSYADLLWFYQLRSTRLELIARLIIGQFLQRRSEKSSF